MLKNRLWVSITAWIFLLIALPTLSYAEDMATDKTTDVVASREDIPVSPFDVDVEIGTQSPWTGEIPVKITIIPKLDSKRTEITWTIPKTIAVEEHFNDYFFAEAGKKYVLEATIVPKGIGLVTGSVDVIDWDYGYNYGTSATFAFELNENLEVVPYTREYKDALNRKYLVIGLGTLMLIALVIAFAIWGFKKLTEYLTPPKDLK